MAARSKLTLPIKDGAARNGVFDKIKSRVFGSKDGVTVSDLDGFIRAFDLEGVMQSFESGELLEWLDAMYYEVEADAVRKIDRNDREAAKKICAAFGIDYDAQTDPDLDWNTEAKRLLLSKKTKDQKILDNARITALNQEDLAELLDRDEPKIYLCGKEFNVPLSVGNKYYIGVLGRPKIKSRAKSAASFSSRDIFFERVRMPWDDYEKDNPWSEPEMQDMLANLKEALETTERTRKTTAKRVADNVYEGSTVLETYVDNIAADVLAFKAFAFKSVIMIKAKGKAVDVRATLMVVSLVLTAGTEITITASGPDAQHAVEELLAVVDARFGR